jgi:hypothetical protein
VVFFVESQTDIPNQVAVAGSSGTVEWEEVNLNTMRKYFALSMVALLALTLAIAALSCGKKEEAPATTGTEQTTPPADTSAMSSDSTGGAAMDTTQAAK